MPTLLRSLVPPLLWSVAESTRRRLFHRTPAVAEGRERDASYYDRAYEESVEYRCHYTASRYYFLWSVIVDRLRTAGAASVLDVGCGSGQFASLLADTGMPRYLGIDLSRRAIDRARTVCPGYSFVASDVFASDLLETADYDAIVSMEFLEHVHGDLDVLRRVRPGVRFLGTVPNFPYESHVRHFPTGDDVRARYEGLFHDFRVDSFRGNDANVRYHLFEGTKA